jgi:hypothetical protein
VVQAAGDESRSRAQAQRLERVFVRGVTKHGHFFDFVVRVGVCGPLGTVACVMVMMTMRVMVVVVGG